MGDGCAGGQGSVRVVAVQGAVARGADLLVRQAGRRSVQRRPSRLVSPRGEN